MPVAMQASNAKKTSPSAFYVTENDITKPDNHAMRKAANTELMHALLHAGPQCKQDVLQSLPRRRKGQCKALQYDTSSGSSLEVVRVRLMHLLALCRPPNAKKTSPSAFHVTENDITKPDD